MHWSFFICKTVYCGVAMCYNINMNKNTHVVESVVFSQSLRTSIASWVEEYHAWSTDKSLGDDYEADLLDTASQLLSRVLDDPGRWNYGEWFAVSTWFFVYRPISATTFCGTVACSGSSVEGGKMSVDLNTEFVCAYCSDETHSYEYDPESGLWIHEWCLDAWWEECEPLPAPVIITCRNGPDVVVT